MSAPRVNFPIGSGGGGGVSGTGTPNSIPIWATATALSDSPLSFASQTLTLAPSVRFFSFGHHQQWTIPGNTAGFTINSTQLVLDTSSGYFGINPPTTPAAPLHVEGNVGSSSELVRLRNTLTGTNSHVTIQTHANATGALSPTGQIRNLTTGTSIGYGTYDWQYRLIDGGGSLQQVFNMSAPTSIGSLTLTAGGTGYTNGAYSQVALTNVTGTGTGATADIVVAGGIVTVCVLRAPGSNYVVGSQLTCASIGAGTGFVVTIATVGSLANSSLAVTAPRIGAGTTTPRAAVDVVGGALFDGAAEFVYSSSEGQAGSFWNAALFGSPSTTLTISAAKTVATIGCSQGVDFSAVTASNLYGTYMTPRLVASQAGSSGTIVGGYFIAQRSFAADLATAQNAIGLRGVVTLSGNVGSATTGTAQGILGQVFNSKSGHTVATATAVDANITVVTGATITTAHGVNVGPISSAGAVTTYYGVRIQNTTAPTITNRWGVSQEDTLAKNYFAGSVGIGSGATSPTQALQVIGGVHVSGTATLGVTASYGTFSAEAGSIFRQYTGDGTGWTWALAKRSASTTTDIVSVNDSTNAMTCIGAVRATGSSAGTPALSTPGDTDTGVYFPAANQIRMSTGGSPGLGIDSSQNLQFNSGYGSIATAYGCRAWVNFDGTASGTFAGGASTVTRVAGSNTATITTTTAHGLTTGNIVYALTGVAAGQYTVTVTTSTQFTITTVATTPALTAVAITFDFRNIRAAGNVNSVARLGAGEYIVNMATAIADANYATTLTVGGTSGVDIIRMRDESTARTSAQFRILSMTNGFIPADAAYVNASLVR